MALNHETRSKVQHQREIITHSSNATFDKFFALPREVIDMVYAEYFRGTVLKPFLDSTRIKDFDRSPLARLLDSIRIKDFERSPLALLLLCSSQHETIRKALWKHATIHLRTTRCFGACAIGDQLGGRIVSLKVDLSRERSLPIRLVSNVLRKLPCLELLHILADRPTLQFQHSSLLGEVKDPRTVLKGAVASLLYNGSDEWVVDMLHPDAFLPEVITASSRAPRIIIDFALDSSSKSHRRITSSLSTSGLLEEFRVPVRFQSDTWAVTGVHHGQSFSIKQNTMVPPRYLRANLMVEVEEIEAKVWNIVQEYFFDINIRSGLAVDLFEEMEFLDEYSPRHRMTQPQDAVDMYEIWDIGKMLVNKPTYGADPESRGSDHLEQRSDVDWEIWRRILKVNDPSILDRIWRDTYKSVNPILTIFPVDEFVEFERQRIFFTRLFDGTKSWPAN